MLTLDQVLLLEQKIESAVDKIQQLQAENAALRTKCDELTNALSSKSEQLSDFESNQSQIEEGIKKALDRLNSIEHSVLRAAPVQPVQAAAPQAQVSPAATVHAAPEMPVPPVTEPVRQEIPPQEPLRPTQTDVEPSFDTMEETDSSLDEDEADSSDELGFDIF